MTDLEPAGGLPDSPRGRKRGIALLLLALAVVAGSIVAGELTQARELEARQPITVDSAVTGTVYCPVTPQEGRTVSLTLAALTDVDAEVTLTRYTANGPVKEQPQLLAGGSQVTQPLEGDIANQPVVIEWRGGPVAAQTQVSTADELLAAPCPATPSSEWYLVGFDTTLRSESLLHLFNPFAGDATVSLAFGTEQGPVQLVRTDEINVPTGQTVVLDLADYQADTVDLAVTVTSVAGRVIPQGEVLVQPPGEDLEGVRGRDLIPAAPVATDSVLVPGARVDELTDSWLTVYNPTVRSAAVQVGVSTPLGDASTLATETTIPAGGTTRIALSGVSALPDFGVRVTSVNGVGIAVTRTDAIIDGDRHAISITGGAATTSPRWSLLGAAAGTTSVTVYNPTPEIVPVTLVAGDQTISALELSPNKLEVIEVPDGVEAMPVTVVAEAGVVAGLLTDRPEGATFVTGIAPVVLVGGGEALRAQRDPVLGSVPAISATATPTPGVVVPDAAGEGGLGGAPAPSETFSPVAPIIATPSDELPSEPPPSPTSSAPSTPAAPSDPAPSPSASAGAADEPATGSTENGGAPEADDGADPAADESPTDGGADEEGDLFG